MTSLSEAVFYIYWGLVTREMVIAFLVGQLARGLSEMSCAVPGSGHSWPVIYSSCMVHFSTNENLRMTFEAYELMFNLV